MRVRTVLAVLGTTTLLTAVPTTPAAAGTGSSTWCNSGGAVNVVVPGVPVTIGIEVYNSPTRTDHQSVVVCYSTTPPGQPGVVTGGAVWAEVYTTQSTV